MAISLKLLLDDSLMPIVVMIMIVIVVMIISIMIVMMVVIIIIKPSIVIIMIMSIVVMMIMPVIVMIIVMIICKIRMGFTYAALSACINLSCGFNSLKTKNISAVLLIFFLGNNVFGYSLRRNAENPT